MLGASKYKPNQEQGGGAAADMIVGVLIGARERTAADVNTNVDEDILEQRKEKRGRPLGWETVREKYNVAKLTK